MLAAAGERVAKQLPLAQESFEGMQWEVASGAVEEDEFLVDWKAQVRAQRTHASRRHACVRGWLQMCALLQPLHENMARSSSFVQVLSSAGAPAHSPFRWTLALTTSLPTPTPAQHVSATQPRPCQTSFCPR